MHALPAATVLALAGLCAVATAAEPVRIEDAKDRQIVAAFLKHADGVPSTLTAEYCKKQAAEDPESYCWIVLKYQRLPLTAYQLTGDAKYLDLFVKCFENLRAAMTPSADGYLDWHGKPLSGFQDATKPGYTYDVIITSFSAICMLSDFVELTGQDAALKEKYAAQRAAYLELMEKHLAKKWDPRGDYVDLGAGGAIYRAPAGLKEDKARLTQPHNKHSLLIRGFLALYRVTGNDEYMRKAVKLGARFKHCLTLKDGHYEWNYWDPAGAWDVLPSDKSKWKHWIGVEHKGGYYASTLEQAVDLYDFGVVFGKDDMDRFLKTQLEKCWNGDLTKPKWARVDGTTSDKYMLGDYLCAALAPLSPKIEEFCYAGPRQEDRLKNAGHSWQGAVVADGWLIGKYLELPKARGGKQVYEEFGRKFRAKPENQAFLKEVEFEVTGEGYRAPKTPAEMKDMPQEPAGK
jgi:hypothetical protein